MTPPAAKVIVVWDLLGPADLVQHPLSFLGPAEPLSIISALALDPEKTSTVNSSYFVLQNAFQISDYPDQS